jgi:hypothetical protein
MQTIPSCRTTAFQRQQQSLIVPSNQSDMHTDHSVQGAISAANRRRDLHPSPVRHQAKSSNVARFAAPLAGPREVIVPASTAQCHGNSNIKAPELSERPSSAFKTLFGALLPKSAAKSVLTMLVRAAAKPSLASYLKISGKDWKPSSRVTPPILCGGVVRHSR